jgi:hypothetical protein
VKLDIQTQALHRRYQIEEQRRQIRVTEVRLAYDGLVCADRDITVQDLQVIQGQTVATGERLGTLAAPSPGGGWMPRPMRQSGSVLRELIIVPAAAGSGRRNSKAVEQGPRTTPQPRRPNPAYWDRLFIGPGKRP